MSTFKFVASIIGFTLLIAACIGVLTVATYMVNHYVVPWEMLIALVPAAGLLGVIITVAIDKPLERT
jgi:hypothetical protein